VRRLSLPSPRLAAARSRARGSGRAAARSAATQRAARKQHGQHPAGAPRWETSRQQSQ
jgi:hypothetical protein